MKNRWRYWTAVLLLVLLPMPSVASAFAAMPKHACCEVLTATSEDVAKQSCSMHDGADASPDCCESDSRDGRTGDHGAKPCSQCMGPSGMSPALPPSRDRTAISTPSGAVATARPVAVPAPPPWRLERPPRVFFS